MLVCSRHILSLGSEGDKQKGKGVYTEDVELLMNGGSLTRQCECACGTSVAPALTAHVSLLVAWSEKLTLEAYGGVLSTSYGPLLSV